MFCSPPFYNNAFQTNTLYSEMHGLTFRSFKKERTPTKVGTQVLRDSGLVFNTNFFVVKEHNMSSRSRYATGLKMPAGRLEPL